MISEWSSSRCSRDLIGQSVNRYVLFVSLSCYILPLLHTATALRFSPASQPAKSFCVDVRWNVASSDPFLRLAVATISRSLPRTPSSLTSSSRCLYDPNKLWVISYPYLALPSRFSSLAARESGSANIPVY
ncbi:hypothetical protein K474DRAFT_1663388 [Panus rudis PR-1116 ss-1]|nr:hypothetical protein K474DRAFT_1663388 [Panus rudis PR-1116 ss-1]